MIQCNKDAKNIGLTSRSTLSTGTKEKVGTFKRKHNSIISPDWVFSYLECTKCIHIY